MAEAKSKKDTKSTKEVAAPKGNSFKLLKAYGKKNAGDKIELGPKGERRLRNSKHIK